MLDSTGNYIPDFLFDLLIDYCLDAAANYETKKQITGCSVFIGAGCNLVEEPKT